MSKIKFLLFFMLISCSTPKNEDDPYKEFNKEMLDFNLTLDKHALRPVSLAYKESTSDGVRQSVSNMLSNIKEPYHMVNYLVTGDAEHFANALFRFVINSTLGFFGVLDIGGDIGLEKANTSYKHTLRTLNVETGEYVVLPVLGFSSERDVVAEPISWFCDPISYFIGFPYMLAKGALEIINDRTENFDSIDSVVNGNLDIYSVTKSVYFQKYGTTQNPDKNKSENDIIDDEFDE